MAWRKRVPGICRSVQPRHHRAYFFVMTLSGADCRIGGDYFHSFQPVSIDLRILDYVANPDFLHLLRVRRILLEPAVDFRIHLAGIPDENESPAGKSLHQLFYFRLLVTISVIQRAELGFEQKIRNRSPKNFSGIFGTNVLWEIIKMECAFRVTARIADKIIV